MSQPNPELRTTLGKLSQKTWRNLPTCYQLDQVKKVDRDFQLVRGTHFSQRTRTRRIRKRQENSDTEKT